MANIQGPFGLKRWGSGGGPPNFALESAPGYRIAAGNTTPIFFGDLVKMNVTGPTGYVEQWAPTDGGTPTKILVGVFVGCSYYSTSQQKWVENRYWPGADATGDVVAKVVTEPNAEWVIQANAGPITQVSMGQTADIAGTALAATAGNTTTGISGMSLASPTVTTASNPLKVVGFVTSPPTAQGADLTTPFNFVIVTFNNQTFKALLGV